uniref:Uncharacterized protein n=1 Tax=Panagrolaimus sp. ES5 TaxID=591445 RepID=A0AC34GSV7_9BILA
MRHFLIPWIFTLLTETVFGQQVQQQQQQSLTDLHKLLLQGAPYRPLFERISPLEGLHVLHQAVAVTPIPENQAVNRLDILGMATPASPYFNPNHRFLTVTVPNPLFNPNLLQPNNFSPETSKKTDEIVKSLPHTISAAILNATEQNKTRAVEIPNKGGFGTNEELSLESKEDGDSNNHLVINKIADNVEVPKVTKIPRAESELTISTVEEEDATVTTTLSTESPQTTTYQSTTIETSTTIVAAKTENPIKSHSLNLSHHLNTTNLESFLNTANISTNEAQVFIKLVEKVLEEEVEKRLQKHEEKVRKHEKESSSVEDESSPPKQSGIKLQPTDVQTSLDIPDDMKFVNDEYIESSADSQKDRHEVKTVDTRLVYQSIATDDTNYDDDESSTAAATTKIPKIFVSKNTPTLSIRTANVIKLPRRIHSTTSLSLEQARTASLGLKKNQQIQHSDDYRAREQAEFDKIIKGSQLSSFNNLQTTVSPITRKQEIVKSENLENYTPMPMTRISSHQTQFERLAKDYQYRLTGTNGLNDLIKALQNAKIGFYERPTYRRYHERTTNN